MEIIDEGKANRHVAVTSKFNREVVFLKKQTNKQTNKYYDDKHTSAAD